MYFCDSNYCCIKICHKINIFVFGNWKISNTNCVPDFQRSNINFDFLYQCGRKSLEGNLLKHLLWYS